MSRFLLPLALSLSLIAPVAAQPAREKKVRDDKAKVEAAGYWIYNDLPRALAESRATGRPVVAVLRCLPCEECVKLDDDLVDTDPVLRPLLDRYVRVRLVSANGLDLSLFQYDYDQSFAAFLFNADGTVYGRFGTRSHRTNWVGDVSIDGLAEALRAGLDLHAGYPGNKAALAGKRGPAPEFPVPERFPALQGKYGPRLNYEGNVVRSCIHCHQVGEAIRSVHRRRPGPLPEEVLFPYPHPKSHGLVLDPKERATVRGVTPGSSAEAAGFRAGDAVRTLAGQPLVSIADVQWVLHRAAADGTVLLAEVVRDGRPVSLTWTLPAGWRQRDDISWRASTWELRRAAAGGMLLVEPPDGRPVGVPATGTALLVKHVGQYPPHDTAKAAGFRPGDVIVAFDGRTDLSRETDLLAYALRSRRPGDTVAVKLIRDGKPMELKLPIAE
ncbi:MAG: Trx7/PDZ domain-containing (seleno)protein [Gemmataceae bacterium]